MAVILMMYRMQSIMLLWEDCVQSQIMTKNFDFVLLARLLSGDMDFGFKIALFDYSLKFINEEKCKNPERLCRRISCSIQRGMIHAQSAFGKSVLHGLLADKQAVLVAELCNVTSGEYHVVVRSDCTKLLGCRSSRSVRG